MCLLFRATRGLRLRPTVCSISTISWEDTAVTVASPSSRGQHWDVSDSCNKRWVSLQITAPLHSSAAIYIKLHCCIWININLCLFSAQREHSAQRETAGSDGHMDRAGLCSGQRWSWTKVYHQQHPLCHGIWHHNPIRARGLWSETWLFQNMVADY